MNACVPFTQTGELLTIGHVYFLLLSPHLSSSRKQFEAVMIAGSLFLKRFKLKQDTLAEVYFSCIQFDEIPQIDHSQCSPPLILLRVTLNKKRSWFGKNVECLQHHSMAPALSLRAGEGDLSRSTKDQGGHTDIRHRRNNFRSGTDFVVRDTRPGSSAPSVTCSGIFIKMFICQHPWVTVVGDGRRSCI